MFLIHKRDEFRPEEEDQKHAYCRSRIIILFRKCSTFLVPMISEEIGSRDAEVQ